MNFLLFAYGFFFALPLSVLNVLPAGLKIDDIILFIIVALLPLLIYKSNGRIILSLPYLMFIFFTILFAAVSFYKGLSNTDEFMGDSAYIVISRIIQTVLIVTFLMFIKHSTYSLKYFCRGFIFAASISLAVFIIYYLSKINLAMFVSRGVYFAKDIFQYNDDLPFTVHVNTLGSFFLIAFFFIRINYARYKLCSYLFILPSFLLISKGDILAIFIYFGYLFYKKNKTNALLVIIFFSLALIMSPYVYELYMGLSEYKVYTSGRDELYGAAITSILNNPLGYGLGMQNNILLHMTGIDFPAHNILLSIGIEFGLLYLTFVVLYICIGLRFITLDNRMIFFAFLVIGLFGNAMYFYKFHSLAIALCFFGLWYVPQTIFKNGTKNENIIYT